MYIKQVFIFRLETAFQGGMGWRGDRNIPSKEDDRDGEKQRLDLLSARVFDVEVRAGCFSAG